MEQKLNGLGASSSAWAAEGSRPSGRVPIPIPMRRADRLFQIVQLLRRDRISTAARLARELGVSERTLYRDVADLMASGVPIESKAGVGYSLPRHFDLPPFMFNAEEGEALLLGARVVAAWGDPSLRKAAESVLRKVEAVLPPDRKQPLSGLPFLVRDFHLPPETARFLGELRQGLREQRRVRVTYARADGTCSDRILQPLGVIFWGYRWHLAAWCELREALRTFRVDQIQSTQLLAPSRPSPGAAWRTTWGKLGRKRTRSKSACPNTPATRLSGDGGTMVLPLPKEPPWPRQSPPPRVRTRDGDPAPRARAHPREPAGLPSPSQVLHPGRPREPPGHDPRLDHQHHDRDRAGFRPAETQARQPKPSTTTEGLLRTLDAGVEGALKALDGASDEDFHVVWTLKNQGQVLFAMPRIAVYRGFVMTPPHPPPGPAGRLPPAARRPGALHLRSQRRRGLSRPSGAAQATSAGAPARFRGASPGGAAVCPAPISL